MPYWKNTKNTFFHDAAKTPQISLKEICVENNLAKNLLKYVVILFTKWKLKILT
jgi:hypothetical protein